jgi:hypothetical protein
MSAQPTISEDDLYEKLAARIVRLEQFILNEAPDITIRRSDEMIGETIAAIDVLNPEAMQHAIRLRLVHELSLPFLYPNCIYCGRSPCLAPDKRDNPDIAMDPGIAEAAIADCYEVADSAYPGDETNRLLEAIESKYGVRKGDVLEELKDLLTHFSPRPKFRPES